MRLVPRNPASDSAMRWPLAEALRPPTMRDGTGGQSVRVAASSPAPGVRRPAGRAAPGSRACPGTACARRASPARRVRAGARRGRGWRGRSRAAGAGETGDRIQRRLGAEVAAQQAAIGDRPDALGARQPQRASPVRCGLLAAHAGAVRRRRPSAGGPALRHWPIRGSVPAISRRIFAWWRANISTAIAEATA